MLKSSVFFTFFTFFFNLNLFAAENIKISDVVVFHFESVDQKKKQFTVALETRKDFKIYEHNLSFQYVPALGLPFGTKYKATPDAVSYLDPFYHEQKKIFQNGNLFVFPQEITLDPKDSLKISVQACSVSMCLMPADLTLPLMPGASSSLLESSSPMTASPSFSPATVEPINQDQGVSTSFVDLRTPISDQVQDALLSKSFLIFPLLFLAGLLMNLTPCVYPMIPITLSVMTHYGQNTDPSAKGKKIFPLIYVTGMVITYALLGVIAGMTGHLFGSQLANPVFAVVMACVMFFLGFAMLGAIQFSAIQNFGNRIPLLKNHPWFAVATMGAVSGLVSAPCTGPVLSMILLLIAQNKDPVSGFVFMIFFALGFGFPYLFLGLFTQKMVRLPRFPKAIFLTKIFFASLMFGLGLFFLKSILQNAPLFSVLFTLPKTGVIAVSFFVLCLSTVLFFWIKNKFRFFVLFFSMASGTVLATWFALWISHAFAQPQTIGKEDLAPSNENSLIHWHTNLEKAVQLAKEKGKPVLVDVWAQWCAACLEMDQTTWRNVSIAKQLNENYIPVKLDYTDGPKDLQKKLEQWNVVGLPGVLIFQTDADLGQKPLVQFQGKISDEKLMDSLNKYQK